MQLTLKYLIFNKTTHKLSPSSVGLRERQSVGLKRLSDVTLEMFNGFWTLHFRCIKNHFTLLKLTLTQVIKQKHPYNTKMPIDSEPYPLSVTINTDTFKKKSIKICNVDHKPRFVFAKVSYLNQRIDL